MLIILTLTTAPAWAQSSPRAKPWLLSQGAASREAKRFSLKDWLENKDKRGMMDMWLTINTPSPYEFVLGGSQFHYDLETQTAASKVTTTHGTNSLEVSAYARFVGVTGEYANNTSEQFNDATGIFNVRLFGTSMQSTHIMLHYGIRTRTAEDKSYRLNQQFAAATVQLYLIQYFGIQANYRSFMPYTENFYGETTANELTTGAFIEFGSFRLFGDFFLEKQTSKMNGVETRYNRNGNRFGLKIYF